MISDGPPATGHRPLVNLLALALIAAVALAACSEASPNFGQFFKGRTLHVSVVALDRMPELRYAIAQQDGKLTNVRVTPSDSNMELVVVRVKVQNHTATSAIFDVDKEGAQLRDFNSERYFPLDAGDRGEIVEEPLQPGDESVKVLQLEPDGTFAPGKGFVRGPIELERGTGLDGWILFEAPANTEFRDFRWQAGDSVTIPF